jgi:PAS domain S-box-containing protein
MNNDPNTTEKEIPELRKRVKELERELLAAQAVNIVSSSLMSLSSNNPHPVLRVTSEGIVVYHNAAAARLTGWRCKINELLPMPLRILVLQASTQNKPVEKDVLLDGKSYTVSVVPVPEECVVNVYGRDITEHKKAEAALAESERRQREISRLLELDQARLAAVLRHLPVGVWIVDQQGRLIGSNPESARIWGEGDPMPDTIQEYGKYVCWRSGTEEPLSIEEHPIVMALQTHELVPPQELKIRRFDLCEGAVLASAAPIKDNCGHFMGVVGVNVDITVRRRMEEALHRSEERLAKAFQATPDAIVISRMSDGLILEVNDGWRKLFGHPPEEIIGKTSIALGVYANPSDRAEILGHLQQDGFLHDFELKIRCKSGETRMASMSVELLEIDGVRCWLSILRDITERKLTEEALRESEWRLRRTQEIAHLGSWELDLVNNCLTWSDEVYRIFGLEPQQFAATYEAFLEAVHPDDRVAVDSAYSSSIEMDKDMYEIEHRVIRRSTGEVRMVHEKCEHFRNQDGKIVRSIGMVHDITDRNLPKA